MLPNKPRGVPRVNDRRVLNGIFWVLRSGAPWRDLPDNFGPYTTCYNRFVRWRRAGVWAKIMSALAGAHDAAVQMIDTSIVRVRSPPGLRRRLFFFVVGAFDFCRQVRDERDAVGRLVASHGPYGHIGSRTLVISHCGLGCRARQPLPPKLSGNDVCRRFQLRVRRSHRDDDGCRGCSNGGNDATVKTVDHRERSFCRRLVLDRIPPKEFSRPGVNPIGKIRHGPQPVADVRPGKEFYP